MTRPLDWTADPPGVPAERELVAFRALLLAHWATQSWAWLLQEAPLAASVPRALLVVSAPLLTALVAVSLTRHGRPACVAALPVVALQAAWILPFTANHSYLATVGVGLCALLDPRREDEGPLLLQSLRWIAVIVFFYAGLQKALHGLYFQGEFLAWMIGRGVSTWGDVFGWLVPAEEIERLRGYPRFQIGAGPYRIASVPFLLVSNAVWIAELALAPLMLARRTRAPAALAAIGLVVVIQSAPHEWMFALLYAQILLLFVPGAWNRRLLPLFLLAYAYLLAALLGAPGQALLLKAGGTL